MFSLFRLFGWLNMREQLDAQAPAFGDRSAPLPIPAFCQAIGIISAAIGFFAGIGILFLGGLGLFGLGILWAILSALVETFWPDE